MHPHNLIDPARINLTPLLWLDYSEKGQPMMLPFYLQMDLFPLICPDTDLDEGAQLLNTRIPRRNNFTLIFIQAGDNVWWDLLKFRVVFNILDSLLAIHLTYPNIRYGFFYTKFVNNLCGNHYIFLNGILAGLVSPGQV